jgi:hypothetical protein
MRPPFVAALAIFVALLALGFFHLRLYVLLTPTGVHLSAKRVSSNVWNARQGWTAPHDRPTDPGSDDARRKLWLQYANGYCTQEANTLRALAAAKQHGAPRTERLRAYAEAEWQIGRGLTLVMPPTTSAARVARIRAEYDRAAGGVGRASQLWEAGNGAAAHTTFERAQASWLAARRDLAAYGARYCAVS